MSKKKKPFSDTGLGKLIWGAGDLIDDTVRGENALGRGLNKVLPAQKLREGLGSAVLGIKDVSPLPQAKDARIRKGAEHLKRSLQEKGLTRREEIAHRIKNLDPQEVSDLVYQAYDLVDDGRLNKSADQLPPELKLKIRLGTSALVIAYAVYALITGDFTLAEAIGYVTG